MEAIDSNLELFFLLVLRQQFFVRRVALDLLGTFSLAFEATHIELARGEAHGLP